MNLYTVECLRLARDTGAFTFSSVDLEADFANEALKEFITGFLPPVGFPKVYISEFSRPPEFKKSQNHFVSYMTESADTNLTFFLSCRYELEEAIDTNRKLKRPRSPKKETMDLKTKRDEEIQAILEVYDEQKQMALMLVEGD
jgi:hypothetical protein